MLCEIQTTGFIVYRKPVKTPVVSKPILSPGVLTRPQIDLIDMRTRPDCISSDVVYQWILHCKDHYSKYSWAYPLVDKSAGGVAKKLRELFFTFGPPKLLHSDNGAELVADVITALKLLFPDMCFIRDRPRHPQSQGLVERGNGVLCDSLGKWMSSTNSSPYEVMFGQKPRSDSDFWRIIKDQNIEDEDMLPVPVEAQQESGESANDYALIDEALAAANSVLGNEGDDESQNDDFFPLNNQSAPSTPVRRLNNP
ncbi:unnamed protein product, partial [Didymodactylos carnosus]